MDLIYDNFSIKNDVLEYTSGLFVRTLTTILGSKPDRMKNGTSTQRSGKGAIRKRFPLQELRWEKLN